jgi:hypothetical protein
MGAFGAEVAAGAHEPGCAAPSAIATSSAAWTRWRAAKYRRSSKSHIPCQQFTAEYSML